jgi:hypothetical protein
LPVVLCRKIAPTVGMTGPASLAWDKFTANNYENEINS